MHQSDVLCPWSARRVWGLLLAPPVVWVRGGLVQVVGDGAAAAQTDIPRSVTALHSRKFMPKALKMDNVARSSSRPNFGRAEGLNQRRLQDSFQALMPTRAMSSTFRK